MSAHHPLNVAVLCEALHSLRDGQLRRCQALGFTKQALQALKDPVSLDVLFNASVCWCSVKVNPVLVQRLLSQTEAISRETTMIDRALTLGASTDLMSRFFGLGHQEIALRRRLLNLARRKGRHPVLSEEQDGELWQRWKQALKQRKIALDDDLAIFELAMDLAEETQVPLSVVWAAMRNWIAQGLV